MPQAFDACTALLVGSQLTYLDLLVVERTNETTDRIDVWRGMETLLSMVRWHDVLRTRAAALRCLKCFRDEMHRRRPCAVSVWVATTSARSKRCSISTHHLITSQIFVDDYHYLNCLACIRCLCRFSCFTIAK